MGKKISRRHFVNKSLGLGTGLLLYGDLNIIAIGGSASQLPVIVTDHTNDTGQRAMKAGWEILAQGGTALDAVERSTNIVELDPEDSVAYYNLGYAHDDLDQRPSGPPGKG